MPLAPEIGPPAIASVVMYPAVLLLASNTAFIVVFGVFVAALVAMVVITVTWAWRRDRAGRAAWRRRQRQMIQLPDSRPETNGHRPAASDVPPAEPRS